MSWVIKCNDAAELLRKMVECVHLTYKLQPGSFPLILKPEVTDSTWAAKHQPHDTPGRIFRCLTALIS